jgi:hypothetical protein
VHKAIVGLAVAAGLLMAASGCGGGSSSLSKAEYEQQLELVCNKGLQEREAFVAKVSEEYAQKKSGTDSKSQAQNIRGFMTVYNGITEKIDEIGLPEQDQKKAEELVQTREDAAAKIEADPLGTFPESLQIFAKPNKISEEFGVHSCAK